LVSAIQHLACFAWLLPVLVLRIEKKNADHENGEKGLEHFSGQI
jgi:hypothetical protein